MSMIFWKKPPGRFETAVDFTRIPPRLAKSPNSLILSIPLLPGSRQDPLFGNDARQCGLVVAGESGRLRTVSVAGAQLAFLQLVAHKSDVDRPPATVGVGLRVVTQRVEMRQIVTDGG